MEGGLWKEHNFSKFGEPKIKIWMDQDLDENLGQVQGPLMQFTLLIL
jgi:hypothetical protein